MDDKLTIERLDLDSYAALGTEGFVGGAAGNSAIAAVGPGPGPGNSAIAAVGPGGSVGRGTRRRAAGPRVSWSHVTPADR
jgi:hypothetical protein